MKIPGAVYIDNDNKLSIGLYNRYSDIYRAPLPSLGDSKRLIHATYSYGPYSRSIDIFSLNSDFKKVLQELDVRHYIKNSNGEDLSGTDIRQDVKYEVVKGYQHTQELITLIRKDINNFCRKVADKPSGSRIEYFDSITPKLVFKEMRKPQLLRDGKKDYVPSCSLEANLDFSTGCVSGIVNNYSDIFAECSYCYSIWGHDTFSKHILHLSKDKLKKELLFGYYKNIEPEAPDKQVRVLRLGKETETGSDYTLDQLVLTLETCSETNTRIVMPTKYLKFNREIADLFKRTNSVVLFSITMKDELERGACSYGRTNEFRLEQATLFKEYGVNTALNFIVDLPHPPEDKDRYVLNYASKQGIPIQLLSIRIPSKKLALDYLGVPWNELKKPVNRDQTSLFNLEPHKTGGYERQGNNMLVAQHAHEFWLNLIGDNKGFVRMCHHDREKTYCGRCFLDDKGFIIPTQHVKIVYNNKKRDFKKKREYQDLFSTELFKL